MRLLRNALAGAGAGAAGTTALNAVTYLDMALRGRGASSTPEETVEKLAGKVGVSMPGDGEARQNRLSGLGSLLGLVAGVAAGGVLGATRSLGIRPGPAAGAVLATAVALAAGNGPMMVVGVTNPKDWSAAAWISDLAPHVAYGVVTGVLLDQLG